jgi:hypothetical protein
MVMGGHSVSACLMQGGLAVTNCRNHFPGSAYCNKQIGKEINVEAFLIQMQQSQQAK